MVGDFPPGNEILMSVVNALVIVGLSEFIAVESQNFGEGVELTSRENHWNRMRLLQLPSHPINYWQDYNHSRAEVPTPKIQS